MSDKQSRWCVLIPCSSEQTWAVPQSCLAEIVTLQTDDEQPPASIRWRGVDVPVKDLGASGEAPWLEARTGTGLVAVVLGLKGGACDYWGVAVRGQGLGVRDIAEEEVEDWSGELPEHASAAFQMQGVVYQVPDLPALQQTIPMRQGSL